MTHKGLTAQTLSALNKAAGRHSRVGHETEDLVQDILLAAIEKGRDCAEPGFLPWALGAIRNRAVFAARTAARRRRRETLAGETESSATPLPRLPAAFVASLPPARRIVALLVNLGMNRREIAHLLGLSDMALRQRLAGLRRHLAVGGHRMDFPDTLSEGAADGLARRALKQTLRPVAARAFAIRDPDGLPIFFSRRDHVSAAAATDRAATRRRAR